MSISHDIPVSVERAMSLLVQAARVDPTLRSAIWDVEGALRLYHAEAADLTAKVRFLLDHGYTWSDGDERVFCFPDGDVWWAERTLSSGPSDG